MDRLIERIRGRAWGAGTPSPPASAEDVAEAERALGCALHPLHRRMLAEIGDGGFGPGFGLFGLRGPVFDGDERTAIELRRDLLGDAFHPRVLPIWDSGCGAWACLDQVTGNVLIVDERGLTDTGVSLLVCMSRWVEDADIDVLLFTHSELTVIHAKTRQPTTRRTRGRPVGAPWKP